MRTGQLAGIGDGKRGRHRRAAAKEPVSQEVLQLARMRRARHGRDVERVHVAAVANTDRAKSVEPCEVRLDRRCAAERRPPVCPARQTAARRPHIETRDPQAPASPRICTAQRTPSPAAHHIWFASAALSPVPGHGSREHGAERRGSGGLGRRAPVNAPALSVSDLERRARRCGLDREEVVLGLAGRIVEHAVDRRCHVGVEDADVEGDRLGARPDGLARRQIVAQPDWAAEARDRRVQSAQKPVEGRAVDAAHDVEPEGIGLFGEDLGNILPDALIDLGLARSPA